MKFILPLLVFISLPLHADNLRPLESDAFSTQEKADEAASIINQNFVELLNSKVDVSTNPIGEIPFFVSDLLNPDQADYNAFVITTNSDELWRGKEERNGGPLGTRTYNIVDLLDPDEIENNIGKINLIFFEIDDAKADN